MSDGSHSAHLVLTLSVARPKPTVIHAGIYSEGSGTLTLSRRGGTAYIDGLTAEGNSYQEAYDELVRRLAEHPDWRWVSSQIQENGFWVPEKDILDVLIDSKDLLE